VAQDDSTGSDVNPDLVGEGEKRGGLDPEAFQRELVFVTATILILGIIGGSCLGMKIQRAEHRSDERAAQQQDDEPDRSPGGAESPDRGRNGPAE